MATVNQTIISILEKKRTGVLDGSAAVTSLLAEVKKQIMTELISLPDTSYASYNLRQALDSIEGHLSTWESTAARIAKDGLGYMWGEGAAMLGDVGRVAGVYSGFGHISTSLLDTLKDFTVGKISGLATDAMTKIQGEISLGILGQQTPSQIAAKIAGNLTDPGIFGSIEQRAETITQTELGRAFSMASNASIEAAASTLPDLEKMWLHAGHPRAARQSHVSAHGQHVAAEGKFMIGNIGMRFPRDPAAPIAEVIHCGCDHVPFMSDWYSPKEFLKDWQKQQDAVNKRRET